MAMRIRSKDKLKVSYIERKFHRITNKFRFEEINEDKSLFDLCRTVLDWVVLCGEQCQRG